MQTNYISAPKNYKVDSLGNYRASVILEIVLDKTYMTLEEDKTESLCRTLRKVFADKTRA